LVFIRLNFTLAPLLKLLALLCATFLARQVALETTMYLALEPLASGHQNYKAIDSAAP
jgi:hypothetical protein